MKAPLLFLNQKEIKKCGGLDMKKTIEIVEEVFSIHQKKDYVLPNKTVLRWGEVETEATTGRINGMPGYIGGPYNLSGIKWISSNPNNPRNYNLPRAAGTIILNDSDNYLPIAVMDGTLISSMRTAATNGVAAKYLANKNSKTVGLIGAGVLNRTILLALNQVLPHLEEVKVYDLSYERSNKFIKEMKSYVPLINLKVVDSAKEAVVNSDVFVTATVTKEPIVKAEWVGKGSLCLHVGGHECEFGVINKADKVIVDDWDKIKSRGNKSLGFMYASGEFDESKIQAQLGEIVNKVKQGREIESDFIYFTSTGMGIQDIAVAKEIYNTAIEKNLGVELDLWGGDTTFI
ncbi:hypothetical protein JSY36_05325 [Bacillus sp. H-16]|uniref:hypothetical protein n=1 Tax=Alteribacter salitolerans TaxID=2912333 RepID=UPI001965138C|nr:hypothetical protein [Alteribacter salitolerans]MBM7095173.1 hypothetical protein [Alteribacter salitolerans]